MSIHNHIVDGRVLSFSGESGSPIAADEIGEGFVAYRADVYMLEEWTETEKREYTARVLRELAARIESSSRPFVTNGSDA